LHCMYIVNCENGWNEDASLHGAVSAIVGA
jgi:hypothetical protein